MKETALNRNVTLHEPADDSSLTQFIDYLPIPYIILLGDPGMGKTTTFQSAAKHEGGKYMAVRNFLATKGKGCENSILYLDALDEFRSRTDDGNLIITLVQHLNDLSLKGLRLSCRAADWFGDSDLELFKVFFDENKYAVVSLDRLSKPEILTLLEQEANYKDPGLFYAEAENKGLEGLLSNPQTLLMLANLVSTENWPNSRTELFEKSCIKLLSETPARSRDRLGQFTAQELLYPAGSICATLLISNVAGISLLSSTNNPEFPSYREIELSDIEKTRSSLTRRAFHIVDTENEAFSYVHRTIAEFLAAKWIVAEVRLGYPIRRFQNLVGVEGVPTSELRGIYAWVTTLLPEQACTLIDGDPLGVVLYGDAANLDVKTRSYLLESLKELSIKDPWFRRSTNWASEALGTLSGQDMVASFTAILNSQEANFHLKDLVLTSIKNSPALPSLLPALSYVLNNSEASYSERIDSAGILSSMGEDGINSVKDAYTNTLVADKSTARLRISIFRLLNSDAFTPTDICDSLLDYLTPYDDHASGELWNLELAIPVDDSEKVLNELSERIDDEEHDYHSPKSELTRFVCKLISASLDSGKELAPERLYQWFLLAKRLENYSRIEGYSVNLKRWFNAFLGRKKALFEAALLTWDSNHSWLWFSEFSECTCNLYSVDEIIDLTFDILPYIGAVSQREKWLYSLIGRLIFEAGPENTFNFINWNDLGLANSNYFEAHKETIYCPIQEWRQRDTIWKKERNEKESNRIKAERDAFEATKDMIRNGTHKHNLSVLAYHYFNELSVDKPPTDSLVEKVGKNLLPYVLDGFYASLSRSELPTAYAIGKRNGTYYRSWYTVLAGMDEAWRQNNSFDALSDEAIGTAFTLSFVLSIFVRKNNRSRSQVTLDWVPAVVEQRTDIAIQNIDQLARGGLDCKSEVNNGVYALLSVIPENIRMNTALSLLVDYPNMHHHHLSRLIFWLLCCEFTNYEQLSEICFGIVTRRGLVKGRQRAIWLVTGCIISPRSFYDRLKNYMKTRPWIAWVIRDLLPQKFSGNTSVNINLEQVEFFAILIANHFDNCDHPSRGWSGNQNPWDAAETVRGLIYRISNDVSRGASIVLKRLQIVPQMETYSDYIAHSLQNQLRAQREAEYIQPDWSATLKALSNKEPISSADLHALLSDHLDTLKLQIRQATTSIFRRFWRHGLGGVLVAPDIEDHCRDHLIDLLRPRLIPLGIRVEPECHMADDKRADIVAYFHTNTKLPLELKRDFHPDMWTACEEQLDRFYTTDPEASGYGIYIVFWFGDERGTSLPKVPIGIDKPDSAAKLESSLNELIPVDKRHRVIAKVLDVSSTENSKGESKVSIDQF